MRLMREGQRASLLLRHPAIYLLGNITSAGAVLGAQC